MTRKIKILQDLDLPKRTLREPPKANYTCHSNNILPTAHLRPSSCWNEGLYLVKNSLEMARAASNHQHTLPSTNDTSKLHMQVANLCSNSSEVSSVHWQRLLVIRDPLESISSGISRTHSYARVPFDMYSAQMVTLLCIDRG